MKNGTLECSVCHSKLVSPNSRTYSKAYDRHKIRVSSKQRALNVLLVVGDCVLVGLQPILVYMSKVDGKFNFSPLSVNFLIEAAKVLFAIVMLLFQARHQKVGEKPLLSISTFVQAARNNVLLAVPAFLYAINNYLKFIMQLYFNPATVKMLSNLKVLVIAVLLKFIMRRRFSIIQWEALALLLIGISVNQLRSLPEGTSAMGLPVATGAYIYTLIFVTVPSMASVFNEYAMKSQYDTSIYLQNVFLYGYGAIFNFLAILVTVVVKGPSSFNILEGHSKATMLLIFNNAAQGILSSFFFKYADTILKKYSSTVATIFTGIASAALFGHTLTINFMLGISIVFISMHQFFSPLAKVKDEQQNGITELRDVPEKLKSKDSFLDLAAAAHVEERMKDGLYSLPKPSVNLSYIREIDQSRRSLSCSVSSSVPDLPEIGLGLTGFGIFFSFLGIVFFFDKGFLAMGNILFISGVSLTIGPKSTMQFFMKRQNFKGTISFGAGFFFVVIGWPVIGMILESYGFIVLFSGFWPTLAVFIQKIPILGWVFQQPFVRSFFDRNRGKRVPV
ncbi:hypothetical protein D5086_030185 [Populus alba]|uniref:Uncharacterized protein n=1 Tax=Populus alba TaxID=43335 RepID=A0ACC4AMS4_POPAL